MPPSLPDNPESNAPDIDRVYAEAKDAISPFVFNHQVAQVFDDMIARSVPGYALCHEVLSLITIAMHNPAAYYLIWAAHPAPQQKYWPISRQQLARSSASTIPNQ